MFCFEHWGQRKCSSSREEARRRSSFLTNITSSSIPSSNLARTLVWEKTSYFRIGLLYRAENMRYFGCHFRIHAISGCLTPVVYIVVLWARSWHDMKCLSPNLQSPTNAEYYGHFWSSPYTLLKIQKKTELVEQESRFLQLKNKEIGQELQTFLSDELVLID